MKKQKFLLHTCCATCLMHPLTLLLNDYDTTIFFYNPNIHPKDEYIKRLYDVKKIAEEFSTPLIIEKYEKSKWLKSTGNLKDAPEGGKRCTKCFKIRLEKTGEIAKKLSYDLFGTTLTISPHKNQEIINLIGKNIAEKIKISFYSADFKKKNGFKNTIDLSKKYHIYRQNYCGCIYSSKKNR